MLTIFAIFAVITIVRAQAVCPLLQTYNSSGNFALTDQVAASSPNKCNFHSTKTNI